MTKEKEHPVRLPGEPTQAQQLQAAQQVKKEQLASVIDGTEAGTIWNEIKDLPIDMFALPAQVVSMHCTPIPAEPSKLFLVAQSSAVLPSLEVAINKDAKGLYSSRFTVEAVEKFLVVSRVQPPLSEILKKYGLK